MKRALSKPNDTETLFRRTGIKLMEDEKLIAVCSIHEAIYWKGVAILLLGVLMLPSFMQNLGILLLIIGAIMLGIAWLMRRFLILAATDKRIFMRSGIVYSDMVELRYSQVESVEIGMTPIGQVFNYANVIVTGTGQRRIIVPFIRDAYIFRTRVNEVLVSRE